jgi:hypothetical protein
LNVDPDPAFHLNAVPDLTFHFKMSIRILCESATNGQQTFQGHIVSFHASIVSVHNPSWPHVEPLKLLNFDFNADPDPDSAFHSAADQDSDRAFQNNADPVSVPQPGNFLMILLQPFVSIFSHLGLNSTVPTSAPH